MKFQLALLAVKDVEVSKRFYCELFEQTVTFDFGRNVTFSGGFAIQEDFHWLTDIRKESILKKSSNMGLYFEVDDFNTFVKKLESYTNI
ncbi:glyoxalase/bleomycin resistance/dioxygenase family protein, partial [Clostridium perfringens]|nr:glyoxalase/bleomycin resistance/dioxygenase family protein [Clostridium perfringens]